MCGVTGNERRSEKTMKEYLVFNAFGAFIIKNKKIVERKFFEDPKNPLREIEDLHKKHPKATFENRETAEQLNTEYEFPNEGGIFLRGNIDSIMKLNNEYYIELVKERIKKASESKDKVIIQAIQALEQIDQSLNFFSERLREWYGLYFPELCDRIEDHVEFAEIVKNEERKEKSMGADLEDTDIEMIKNFAGKTLETYNFREELVGYIKENTEKLTPNLSNLINPLLVAKLISLAGSLKKLARLPASTIQVLGAEPALFRHLRKGTKPPKHGIIFQDPRIHTAPRWQRGKIARSMASKIAIAARLDFYSGEFNESISGDFEIRLAAIRKKYKEKPGRR